ncbi:MAG: NAD(P)-dependent oxidoreductase [Acidobacteriota bacterium]
MDDLDSRSAQTQTVAVLGLGAMGSRLAVRLAAGGFRVIAWNRSPVELRDASIRRASSPRDAAARADIVLAMLTDDEASAAVWLGADGALAGLRPGTVAVEASTLTPAWVLRLSDRIRAAGAALLEAPVVGSRPQAEAGQLISLAAGDRAVFEGCSPMLDTYSSRTFYLGEAGQAAAAKLAVNTFFATQVAAAAETIHFLRSSGVEDERWLDLFTNLPVVPPPIAGAMAAMAANQFAPQFPIAVVDKDLRYFSTTADARNAEHPLASAVRGLFSQALEQNLGQDNITGVAQVYGGS